MVYTGSVARSDLKLNPAMITRIADLHSMGVDVGTVCRHVGISRVSYYVWLGKGEERGADPIYVQFYEAVNKAQANVAIMLTQSIIKHAKHDWRAAAWWLERRKNSVYGDPKGFKFDEDVLDRLSAEGLRAAKALLSGDEIEAARILSSTH